METNRVRTKDFKIGCFHGRLNPDEQSREAVLRNQLYLIGSLKIEKSNTDSIAIRFMGYELPLQTGQKRGECIDLFGYDKDKNPYIIELKVDDSNEKIQAVIDGQLEPYKEMFRDCKDGIEKEIQDKYFWPDFKLTENIQTVILSFREFYKGKTIPKNGDAYICSFSRIPHLEQDKQEIDLLSRFGSKGSISLKWENK